MKIIKLLSIILPLFVFLAGCSEKDLITIAIMDEKEYVMEKEALLEHTKNFTDVSWIIPTGGVQFGYDNKNYTPDYISLLIMNCASEWREIHITDLSEDLYVLNSEVYYLEPQEYKLVDFVFYPKQYNEEKYYTYKFEIFFEYYDKDGNLIEAGEK